MVQHQPECSQTAVIGFCDSFEGWEMQEKWESLLLTKRLRAVIPRGDCSHCTFFLPQTHLQSTWRHSRVMSLKRTCWASRLWGVGPLLPTGSSRLQAQGSSRGGRGFSSALRGLSCQHLSCKSRGDKVAHGPLQPVRCSADTSGVGSPGGPVTYRWAILASCFLPGAGQG